VVDAVQSASRGRQVLDRRSKVTSPSSNVFETMHPINLQMVQRGVGRMPGEAQHENELTVNVFQRRDFEMSDASAKMNVATASRIFSRKAQTATRWAGNKGLIPHRHPRLPSFTEHDGVLQVMSHVDDMWDVFNTNVRPDQPARSKGVVHSSNDPQIGQLLQHLAFFHGWQSGIDATPGLSASQKEAAFLPSETWAETRSLCLGFVCLTKHHVRPRPSAEWGTPRRDGWLDGVAFCRVTTDPAENHFADVRLYANGSAGLALPAAMSATAVAASVSVSKAQHTGEKRKQNSGGAGAAATVDLEAPFTKKRLKIAQTREWHIDKAKYF